MVGQIQHPAAVEHAPDTRQPHVAPAGRPIRPPLSPLGRTLAAMRRVVLLLVLSAPIWGPIVALGVLLAWVAVLVVVVLALAVLVTAVAVAALAALVVLVVVLARSLPAQQPPRPVAGPGPGPRPMPPLRHMAPPSVRYLPPPPPPVILYAPPVRVRVVVRPGRGRGHGRRRHVWM